MVPNIQHYKLPLLPFERELIQLAGITEDEYRLFVSESLKRAQVRPAEYDRIPDIRCEPISLTSILVSLAVGVALSAASYLLTPKPRVPDLKGLRESGRRDLGNRTGAEVFSPTSGFDSLASLANFDDPIPLIFGRYTGTSGGILISPKLVWSRALSYGTEQGVKMMFVVGESGVNSNGIFRPTLSGVFLGNSPLSGIFSHQYAFYWTSGTFDGTSRLKARNFQYGSRGSVDSGDPQTNDDIFTAPVRQNAADPAFCMSYTPSTNAQFGAYSPVYNGTDFRVNFKLVPIPVQGNGDNDPRDQLILQRIKVAGDYGITTSKNTIIAKGQSGIGRGYSRRMGVTALDGSGTSTPDAVEQRSVSVGSRCTFTISGTSIPDDFYYSFLGGPRREGVQVDDINNEINGQRTTADAVLQLGETIQIGATLWKVTSRSSPVWQAGSTQVITLDCIELLGRNSSEANIGLVGRNLLEKHVLTAGTIDGTTSIVPITYFPLMRTQLATIRNTRACDATEFGIRSQVWNRANGLCNFNGLPSPLEFINNENDNVSINSGSMSLYMNRTSVFSIQLRPADPTEAGSVRPWADLGLLFCVSGNQPVDQYNYIRIEHPQARQYEYRFVPRPGANIMNAYAGTEVLWRLNARSSILTEDRSLPDYGSFRVVIAGERITRSQVQFNSEMATLATSSIDQPPSTTNKASTLRIASWVPSSGFDQQLIEQAFMWELFGDYQSGKTINTTYRVTKTYTVAAGKSLQIQWSAILRFNGDLYGNTSLFPNPPTNRLYRDLQWSVVPNSVTGNWSIGDIIQIEEDLNSANPHLSRLAGIRREGESSGTPLGPRLQVAEVELVSTPGTPGASTDRVFERNSQLADVSFYGTLLQKSNESQPEHTISYVNEITRNPVTPNYTGLVTCGLALKASRTFTSVDQLRVWRKDGMTVNRFHPDEAGTQGPSNLLCDLVYYLLTDKVAGAGATISASQIRTNDFAGTARFLRTNELFFDGVIADPSNIRQYLTQLAPFFLCNFVISDGLFSLVPALPTTSSGAISANAISVRALFTDGNILDGSFGVEYINSEERNSMQAVLRYRFGAREQLPEERTVTVRWNESGAADQKIETYDLTQFCTNRDHAVLVGKYLLSVRRRVTHTIKFKTTPEGLSLAPGDFIRVITQVSPYSGANNGVINDSGGITSVSPLPTGSYSVLYYRPPATSVAEGTLTVSNGSTSQTGLFGSVFTVLTSSTQSNVYVVEQLSFDENGMVDVAASEFPTDSSLRSLIALDLLSTTAFTTES